MGQNRLGDASYAEWKKRISTLVMNALMGVHGLLGTMIAM
jgi:hypothetical protein